MIQIETVQHSPLCVMIYCLPLCRERSVASRDGDKFYTLSSIIHNENTIQIMVTFAPYYDTLCHVQPERSGGSTK